MRYAPPHARFESVREPFTHEIEKYLPASMAHLFVRSRFYLADRLHKEVYAALEGGTWKD